MDRNKRPKVVTIRDAVTLANTLHMATDFSIMQRSVCIYDGTASASSPVLTPNRAREESQRRFLLRIMAQVAMGVHPAAATRSWIERAGLKVWWAAID